MPPALHFDTPGLHFDAGLRYDSGDGPGPDPNPPIQQRNKQMNKFKLELRRRTVFEKLSLGDTHITAMTGNAAYPVLDRKPLDAAMQAAQDDLAATNSAVDAAEASWRLRLQEREASLAAWETAITTRANYCEAATPNDIVALTSTGFPLRALPSPIGILPMPVNLQAKASNFEGQIDLMCDAVAGAAVYEWECRLHGEGIPWVSIKSTTTRKIAVTGLTAGAQYAFRVRVLGAAGPSAWSDEAVKRCA